jgi:hypothetical protein
VELFFTANFVVWWLAIASYPHTFFGFASDLFRPAAGLAIYYWLILGLAVINLAQQVTNVFRPQWTWLRPATLLATSTTFLILLRFMLRISPLVVLRDQYSQVERYVYASGVVNIVAFWMLAGIGAGMFIACVVYAYQLVQFLRRGRAGAAAAAQSL